MASEAIQNPQRIFLFYGFLPVNPKANDASISNPRSRNEMIRTSIPGLSGGGQRVLVSRTFLMLFWRGYLSSRCSVVFVSREAECAKTPGERQQ
jgi:hypothetical protein